jgi:cytochrome c
MSMDGGRKAPTQRAWAWVLGAAVVLGAGLAAGFWREGEQSAPPDAGLALARERGCLSCHGLVHKQVGPGYAQVAQRYRGEAQALARLAGEIRAGSVGRWGRVIMPRQPQVSEAEARQLAAWVLARPDPR